MTNWNREYDLVIDAQNGDEESIHELYERYLPTVYKWAEVYKKKGVKWEDALAAGKHAFFRALSTHDPSRGYLGPMVVQFCRFYCRKEIELLKAVRPIRKSTAEYKKIVVSNDKGLHFVPIGKKDPNEDREKKEHMYYLMDKYLDDREKEVVTRRAGIGCKPETFITIGKSLGVTQHYASMIYNGAINKMRIHKDDE